MTGPFAYLAASVDTALASFVATSVANLAEVLRAPVMLGLSISVLLRGLAILRGSRAFHILDSALDLTFQAILLTLALSAATYMNNVVALADGLVNALLGLFGNRGGYEVLDDLEAQGATISTHYIALGVSAFPGGGYIDMLTGLLMAGVIATVLVVIGGYFLIAKVALSLVLTFGPLFVAARAFKPTQHWFTNWTNKLFNYALLAALMAATLALVDSIYGQYLNHLSAVGDATNPIADLIDLVVLSGVLIILAVQMPRLAAALTSGAAVSAGPLMLAFRAAPQSSQRLPAGNGASNSHDNVSPRSSR